MKQIFIFLLLPFICYSQNKIDSINNVNIKNIDILKNDFKGLNEKYEYQLKINEQTLNSIGTQLDAVSFNISIFAFLFGIIAIGLGIYVTWVERKIVKLRDENQSLLNDTKNTKKEVVEINELIQKDIYGLFLKIKREETLHILNRLISVPQDVTNVSSELLSRELYPDDYNLLKKAYLNLPKEEPIESGYISLKGSYKDSYLLLFFQHFLEQATKDEDLNIDLREFYSTAIRCAFENDILKSTRDFIKSIKDLGYENSKVEINNFFNSLSQSKYKNFTELFENIFRDLKDKESQYIIINMLDDTDANLSKINLGTLFIKNYENDTLNEKEKELIKNLKTLVENHHKMLEEQRKSQEQNEKLSE